MRGGRAKGDHVTTASERGREFRRKQAILHVVRLLSALSADDRKMVFLLLELHLGEAGWPVEELQRKRTRK
jgi:hypothetical protein